MTDPTTAEHPARAASQRSMAAVSAGDRAAWLALFADDAVVEDPIGPSMFDPDGAGHRGLDAVAAFFDTVIEGVYTYRVNDAGQLTALRAFWEADAITFEPATA